MNIVEEGEYVRAAVVSGKRFLARYDQFGYAVAVTCNGVDIVHLLPGSLRNIVGVAPFIEHVNDMHKACNQHVPKVEDRR